MSTTFSQLAFDVALGASNRKKLTSGGARWLSTLADPEGNEFDVIAG
jgi:hypothetical protein